MTPGSLMWLGFICAMAALALDVAGLSTAIVLAFGAGAVFGKGYGVWEERERERP